MTSHGEASKAPSSQGLVRRLMTHPRTADLVKELQVHSDSGFPFERKHCRERLISRVVPFENSSISPELEEDICNAIKDGSEEGCVAYLMAICKNLETIEFSCGINPHKKLIKGVIEHTASGLPQAGVGNGQVRPLQSVQSITLSDHAYEIPLATVVKLLCLPQLRFLSISGVADNSSCTDRRLPDGRDVIANSNPITFILDSTMMNGEGLAFLLATCPNAKSLTMRWRLGLWNEDLRKKPIGDAIRKHGTNIEYLHLDTLEADEFNKSPTRNPDTILLGSFSSLHVHTLVLPITALAKGGGTSLSEQHTSSLVELPHSLTMLYVLGVEPHAKETFESLRRQPIFPNLKEVTCVGWHHYKVEEWFGRVQQKCINYNRFPELRLKNIHED